jgi:nitrogen fixation/metabolism regulation signal transduction histidine kinase
VEVVELALDIFTEDFITKSDSSEIVSKIDRNTTDPHYYNLVKNATQSMEQQEHKKVFVNVKDLNNVLIGVADNGTGISPRILIVYSI